MSTKELLQYCLEKKGVFIDYTFGNDYITIKTKSAKSEKSRIFAEFYTLNGKEIFTFSTIS